MAKEVQYTANTGFETASTANSNLDGTGTLVTILTAASSGTLLKSVNIKATGNTTEGMVRLFITSGANTRIIAEVHVPAITKGANDPSFETRLNINYDMESGDILKASTQNAESFVVVAEGLDFAYYAGAVRYESTKFTANTGMGQVTTANTNLDGTGTIADILTVPSSGANGTEIASVTVKATSSTTAGMVRLFVYNGSSSVLLTEIPVEARTRSASQRSFSKRITFGEKGLALKAGWKLRASTEKGETFNVIAEGLDWAYPA